MRINEIPEVVQIPLYDEEKGQVWVDATVLFISEKLVPTEKGGGEDFIVMCYDEEGMTHEIHLNTTKIIKTRKVYEQTRATFNSNRKRSRKGGKKNDFGYNNSGSQKGDESKRESD